MPKAGSSALQARLRESRGALRRAGILYPRGGANPNLLAGAGAGIAEMPRLFRQAYGGDDDAFRADVERFWTTVRASVARSQARTAVLSAEALWGVCQGPRTEALAPLLRSIADEIDAVVYVRRPSEFYLSYAQQAIKASSRLPPARAVPYRASLEAIGSVADRLHVLAYDRSRFPSGDIVLDFARRFVPEAEATLASADAPPVNESLSAEAMTAVQDYRCHVHGGQDDVATADTRALVRGLRRCEAALGGVRRPELHAHVREHIDGGSPDLAWLRDVHGVAFPGIDYAKLGPREPLRPSRIADICPVDEARKDGLVNAVLAELLREHGEDDPGRFHMLRHRRKRGRRPPRQRSPSRERTAVNPPS